MFPGYGVAVDWTGDPYSQTDSPGLQATSPAGHVVTDGGVVSSGAAAAQAGAAPRGNPIKGLITAAVILLGVGAAVHKFGKPTGEFKHILVSPYDAAITAAIVVAVVPLYKMGTQALARTPLPFAADLNTYVQAA